MNHEVQPVEPDVVSVDDYRVVDYTLPLGSIITFVVITAVIMLLVRWSKSR